MSERVDKAAERAAVMRAFWSRGRRQFVPLTIEDVCRRTGMEHETAWLACRGLAVGGLVRSLKFGNGAVGRVSVYELTVDGVSDALALIVSGSTCPDHGPDLPDNWQSVGQVAGDLVASIGRG